MIIRWMGGIGLLCVQAEKLGGEAFGEYQIEDFSEKEALDRGALNRDIQGRRRKLIVCGLTSCYSPKSLDILGRFYTKMANPVEELMEGSCRL